MSFSFCDLWLMEPAAMRQFQALARVELTPEVAARQRESRAARREQQIAVLPVHGPIEARASLYGDLLGMTSAEAIGQAFDALMADDSVAGVILDVASPGGMVYGTPELANKIYSARGTKPIIAVANPVAASGAYWIAAAADRLIASPTADVGSVGVIFRHVDDTAAEAQDGLKTTLIRSAGSPYKQDVSSGEPLTEEAKEYLQARADAIYEDFTADLAKFRGLSVAAVKEHFGKGRLVDAKSAMQVGMIDRIDSFQSILGKLMTGRLKIGNMAAADEWDSPTDAERFRLRVRERQARVAAIVGEN
jgi:signal peptide peptidase SppA